MAKITLGRIFETGKALATEAGKQLADVVEFVADMSEEVLGALRNGLTFEHNFDCKVMTLELRTGVEQAVNVGAKRATGMIPVRVVSTAYALDSFLWYVDSSGTTKVKATFTGSPPSAVQLTVVILF